MKKNLLSILVCSLLLIGCDINISFSDEPLVSNSAGSSDESLVSNSAASIEITNPNQTDYVVNNVYENGKVTIKLSNEDLFFNPSDYNIEHLYAGDKVSVNFDSSHNIVSVEVTPAPKIEFIAVAIPGGGVDVLRKDTYSSDYKLPNYIIYDNDRYIDNISYYLYNGVEMFGTYAENNSNEIIALYSSNYVYHTESIKSSDEKMNEYFEYIQDKIIQNTNYALFVNIEENDNTLYSYIHFCDGQIDYIFPHDSTNYYELSDCKIIIEKNKFSIISPDNIKYEANENGNHFINDFIDINDYLDIYNRNKPLVIGNEYEGYTVNYGEIDPCCGGPKTILLSKEKDGVDYCVSIRIETYDVNSVWLKDDSIPYKEYADKCVKAAAEITFNEGPSLLEKFENYPDEEKYLYDPGFGEYSFADKKYESFENDTIVKYSCTAFPDCYFNDGTYVTSIVCTDKDFVFNGLTLNNTTDEIVNTYVKLGFTLNISFNPNIYVLNKEGVYITLTSDSIIFSSRTTNYLRISY